MTTKRALATSALSCLLAWSALAPAQVNVEPLRREISGDGIGLHVLNDIAAYQGNSEGITLGLGLLFGGRAGRHFGYLSASADYSHLAQATQTAKAFAHVRNNYQLTPRLWSELFGQVEADRFRRIGLRELIGAGPRLALFRSKPLSVFLGTAYMLEYTRLSSPAPGTDSSSIAHRSSTYVSLTWTPDDRTSLSQTAYLQPRFDAPSDLQALSVTNLRFAFGRRLASRIDATARYDTRAPARVEAFDLELKNSLELRF